MKQFHNANVFGKKPVESVLGLARLILTVVPLRQTVFVLGFGLLAMVQSGWAVDFTVQNTNDSGAGSLRQAVFDANANIGADTIAFDASLNRKTIVLTSGQLQITDDLTIIGPGADQINIDGYKNDRIFLIDHGDTVSISGLTISNGYTVGNGGGIFNNGTLTLSNSTVTGNSADKDAKWGGGIHNTGTLTLTESTVSGNSANQGGGINQIGTMTLSNSTVSDNWAVAGSGIFNNGTLTMINSAVVDNTANGSGGGILDYDGALTLNSSTVSGNTSKVNGGGIWSSDSKVTLNSSTVSGNSASWNAGGIVNFVGKLTLNNSTVSGNTAVMDAGGIGNSGILTLNNSTITSNTADNNADRIGDGGGIFLFGGTTTMENTIVAGNSDASPSGNVHPDISGSIKTANNSLIQSTVGTTITTGNDNIIGQDPQLGEMQDNGGETFTHALLPGSPAIDAGKDLSGIGITNDQRGAARPQGSAFDIGAFEFGAQPPTPTPTSPIPLTPTNTPTSTPTPTNTPTPFLDPDEIVVLNNFDSGPGSLRQAILDANAGIGTPTITFDNTLKGATIILTSGQLEINDDLTITGPGADQLTINGNNNDRIFLINSGKTVAISGLTISNGIGEGGIGNGGGIFNNGALTLSNSTVRSNSGKLGGGISNTGTMTLSNSTVSGNTTGRSGGGISNTGTLTLSNSTITNNTAANADGNGGGGGVSNTGTLTLNNSTVSGNSAGFGNGGGISNTATLTLSNSTVSGNSGSFGGGILNNGALTLSNSTVSGNSGSFGGGGIYNSGTLTMSNSTITNNTADANADGNGDGGGVVNRFNGTISMVNTIIAGNTDKSGIIHPDISGTVNAENSLIGDSAGTTFDIDIDNIKNLLANLGELQDNGGGTFTHALLPGSPAIDAGKNLSGDGITADQRGIPRPQGGAFDIGAFEVVEPLADVHKWYVY